MKKTLTMILSAGLMLQGLISYGQKPVDQKSCTGPIDPQKVQDQDDMTWNDYHPIPGKDWADPSLKPKRGFRIALVAVDFPDQPFVITLPKKSDLFGNPQIDPIKREDVAKFYTNFYWKPSDVNHGHTINGYWMEQSWGQFGITQVDAFGPYRMPKELWKYGLSEWGQNKSTPDGSTAHYWMEKDVDSVWKANAGDLAKNYDAILRIYAGYDETGIWQEFGEMKFLSKDDIPAEWGNPDPDKPRWIITRYVPWTSWKAGAQQWGISSMRQGENSGTITHELGHFAFNIGDNNNNPYVKPYRRAGSGPWDMMDRGSFNGPGGPHHRWVVPAVGGAAMPAGLMVRNRMINGFITDNQVLTLSREKLATTGLVVANVTARAVRPHQGEFTGIIVRLDGKKPHDRTPLEDPEKNPLTSGTPNYDYYSMEVVQRIGYDSFCPDNGVLLAKNKDKESSNGGKNGFNCFNWVIDAHPEDINVVDYVKPDGTKIMRTVADYRQLNDALFHAGFNSGSQYEYVDPYNKLHFYVIDIQKDKDGIISYTLGVKSLDDKNLKKRACKLVSPAQQEGSTDGKVIFTLSNNDKKQGDKNVQSNNYDIYRLSVSINGEGWKAEILNGLTAVEQGKNIQVPVYVSPEKNAVEKATVTLTAVSESNPSVKTTATFVVGK